ncbi:alpha/beta hydrolase [Flavobacterium adhaerens]|uniref:alpha/beta hydrolase n=1 Tax=Flavobacterium adhaerens TaxID=3149043 RepID=UPI0032B5437C
MPKSRLLILSDLFGSKKLEWINYYIEKLEYSFDIQYYDVLKLGEIRTVDFDEKDIHSQFLENGIDKAVQNLLNHEKEKVFILGFSIGGTIAWKASLQGLKVLQLFAVSSTRLRYETQTPNCKLKLYFGEDDSNRPNTQWFLDLNVSNVILPNQNHQLYLEHEIIALICNEILNTCDSFLNNNCFKND